ncbi:helix-turn-helix transcriptional regulator [Flavobacterium branchiarum]|uniref:Helix-turn-helix domain-containing protein n=1 Tax=Flavobacterium branchiarum TaxID=1114870 RepID=A0ABV5FSG6_9FLAO|nr:helix-turn-helix transcriptional regulator [Flavobacterium branchiarum]MDN3674977.1 helix-turn-helix transcriptional regulator [Flavobacterium branchiarum]
MNVIIGKKLKKLRKNKNLSQEQIADFLCISQSAYARIERGESNSWSSHINIICEVFKISPVELMKEDIVDEDEESNSLKESLISNPLSEELIEQYAVRIRVLEKVIKELKIIIKDHKLKSSN